MNYFKNNLLSKIREWTSMLDDAGDLNEMMKVLMNKTLFDLDYEFFKLYPELANTCGCTANIVVLIEGKVYAFSVGDCKAYLFRNETIYQLSLDHIPVIFLLYCRAEATNDQEFKTQEGLFNMID